MAALIIHTCFYYTSKPECAIPDDNCDHIYCASRTLSMRSKREGISLMTWASSLDKNWDGMFSTCTFHKYHVQGHCEFAMHFLCTMFPEIYRFTYHYLGTHGVFTHVSLLCPISRFNYNNKGYLHKRMLNIWLSFTYLAQMNTNTPCIWTQSFVTLPK